MSISLQGAEPLPAVSGDVAIRLDGVGKAYRIWRDPAARLKAALWHGAARALPPLRDRADAAQAALCHDFHALRNISIEVKRGESLGIIGRNGSGKSTLLQIIAGTLAPTTGRVEIAGRVAALLELGSGFNPEFTGRENVQLNAAILGLSEAQVAARFDDIAAFADIGEFLEQPVKTYSSGMMLRLAFAVQTAVEPDVLIVDEALAVGDMFFQAKCMTRLRRMLDNGLTLLLVSHEPGTLKSLCQRALLLDKGVCLLAGTTDRVAERYFALKVESPSLAAPADAPASGDTSDHEWNEFVTDRVAFDKRASYGRSGNRKAVFTKVALLDESGSEIEAVAFGQACRLRIAITVKEGIESLAWGVHIRDALQREVLYTDNTRFGFDLTSLAPGTRLLFELRFELSLKEDRYTVHVGCGEPIDLAQGQAVYSDLIPIACQFYAARPKPYPIYAPVFLHSSATCKRIAGAQA